MNTANLPGFTAETSLYKTSGLYHIGVRTVGAAVQIIPAIPMCRNCDDILDRCSLNGWRPRALCTACALGHCFDEPPLPNPFPDPFDPLPRF